MPNRSNPGPGFPLRLTSSFGVTALIFLGWMPVTVLTWKVGQDSLMGLPLLLIIAGTAAFYAARGGLLVGSAAFAGLTIRDGRLLSMGPQGTMIEWLPGRNCRLFSRLAWLELTTASGPRRSRLLLLNDLPVLANLPREDFRRLKVWLRLGASYQ